MNQKALKAIAMAAFMALSVFSVIFVAGNASVNGATIYEQTAPNSQSLQYTTGHAATGSLMTTEAQDLARVTNLAKQENVPMKNLFIPNYHSSLNYVNGHVTPSYPSSPAPMGIGDYGLYMNNTGQIVAYNYTTTSFEATVNMSNLQDFNIISDSPQAVTFQLNAVLYNVALFGKANYSMWTQNVIVYSARTQTLTFEDNVWNFSSPQTFLTSNAINYSSGFVYPYTGVHIAIGPQNIPVHYPWQVNLYMNTTVTDRESTMWFNYSVPQVANMSGTYDMIEFNSTYGQPANYTAPQPEYLVSGTQITPTGFIPYDSEIMIGGPGGGSTATVYNINGTMTLSSLNSTTNTYTPVKSAYDIGSETGETSTGVDVSYSGTTAHLNPGPSMVYGLWGLGSSQTQYKVTTTNSVTPYVFVNNNATQISENIWNWAPFPAATETFTLPTSSYQFEAAMNYFAPETGVLSSSGTTITLQSSPLMGVYTPITIMNNQQLASYAQMAANAVGATPGNGTPSNPYVIYAQSGGISSLFSEINDYMFPSFPGVLIMDTNASAVVTGMEMPIQYTGYSALIINFFDSAYGVQLPLSNFLELQLYETSNIAVENGVISGWLSFEQTGFFEGSMMVWNSTNDVIANNMFISYGASLLVYNNNATPSNNVITGNEFLGLSYTTGNPIFADSPLYDSFLYGTSQIGVYVFSSGNMIFNNTFLTQTPAEELSYNFYWGVPANYTNEWNSTSVGNYWWNYYGAGPYNDSGAIMIGYDYKPIVYPNTFSTTVATTDGNMILGFAYSGLSPMPSSNTTVVTPLIAAGVPVQYIALYLTPSMNEVAQEGFLNISGPGQTFYLTSGGPSQAYSLVFTESGLPSSTTWTVSVNGQTYSSNGASITASVSSGNYTYSIGPVSGYTSSPSMGTVTVTGNTSVAITFQPSSYTVTFTETGLPSGTTWVVGINGQTFPSTSASNAITVPTGTYTYSIGSVSGYTVSPSSGPLTVNGNETVSLTFTQITYTVTFTETGLPSGTSWGVTLGTKTLNTTSSTITFTLTQTGTYTYTISNVSGYSGVKTGSISVNGNSAQGITFTKVVTPPAPSSSNLYEGLVVGLIVGLIVGILVAYAATRKKK